MDHTALRRRTLLSRYEKVEAGWGQDEIFQKLVAKGRFLSLCCLTEKIEMQLQGLATKSFPSREAGA